LRWHEFAAACPEIATLAENRFRADQLQLVGTIRKDGSARISPNEVDLAAGELFVGMMWQSRKALDLARDPRCVLHSVPSDKDNPGGDVKLYSTAVDVRDPALARGTGTRSVHGSIGPPRSPISTVSRWTSSVRATSQGGDLTILPADA